MAVQYNSKDNTWGGIAVDIKDAITTSKKQLSTESLDLFSNFNNNGEEFVKVIHEAQMLLHIESFDEICIDRVKNSISTKIADSLASGIPILAYGPSNIASISYLKKNKCAYVIDQKENLEELLRKIILYAGSSNKISNKGLFMAKMNHNSRNNSILIKKMLTNITESE